MLNPADIQGLAQRKYPDYLRSLVTSEPLFPLRIRFGKPSSTEEFGKLSQEVVALSTGNFGYTIEWELKNTRKYGTQNLPVQVRFDSEEQFVKAIGKQREVEQFRTNLAATTARLPQLQEWMAVHVKWVVEFGPVWDEMLKVCEYFLANPRPGLYTRQLPIAVHTKFIQENAQVLSSLLSTILPESAKAEGGAFESRFGLKMLEPLIRFRVLDPNLQSRLEFTHAEMGLPLSVFCSLKVEGVRVIITENLMNFECLPGIPNGLAIWGQGNAAELLHAVPWLSGCAVHYWGDIDEHGFHILARLRSKFPSIRSIMMDLGTLENFRNLTGPGERAGKTPINLTDEERLAYETVVRDELRLEQEKIPQSYSDNLID
jgi:hypothetical protein